ncbi:MAG: hypothetical protein KatS3mg104_0279 [Phycisphaerae bacterium]|jgi:hypothetical protein|nr:MAG: hypothetical protein KatS3mg104_0279 [Phycisphaerae bacterium]
MTGRHDWSKIFWATMLPVSWVLALVLGWVAQIQAKTVVTMTDLGFQSTLYMSLFLGLFGLIAVRILIARALDDQHRGQACLVGGLSLLFSVGLIIYGLCSRI